VSTCIEFSKSIGFEFMTMRLSFKIKTSYRNWFSKVRADRYISSYLRRSPRSPRLPVSFLVLLPHDEQRYRKWQNN
jgi:hypothetical protein